MDRYRNVPFQEKKNGMTTGMELISMLCRTTGKLIFKKYSRCSHIFKHTHLYENTYTLNSKTHF
jgi:hypothetical protein